ncbi:MAG: metalloregulator ArsR/SmtB family transcription factor [Methylophilaceae bacterium]
MFDRRLYFHKTRNMERQIAIAALDALAHASRLDIFRLLVQAGEAGMPAGKIGEQLGISNATLSFHLQQLKQASLVSTLRKGTQIMHMANYGTMNGLIGYLTENCCQGSSEPCLPTEACCSPVMPETTEFT